ncbi:MAG: RNA polymerase sigma factor [Alphaproteobacteria bacterium]|nr:RNA polymerase sigma factor [Alphaproteobacteria bacterium]
MTNSFNEIRLKVRSVIKRITGSVNEDLEQEVFLKAIEHKEHYEEEGKLIAWLKMIAQNTAKDMFKSSYFRNSAVTGDLETIQIEDKNKSALDVQLQKERQKIILKAVDSLPIKMRDVIYLYEFEELSYEETALKLGISVGTVKSRLFNAREILSQKLSHLKGE